MRLRATSVVRMFTSITGTSGPRHGWRCRAFSAMRPQEVVAVGADVQGIAVGDLVSAETHIPCGHCYQCRTGKPGGVPAPQNPGRRYRWRLCGVWRSPKWTCGRTTRPSRWSLRRFRSPRECHRHRPGRRRGWQNRAGDGLRADWSPGYWHCPRLRGYLYPGVGGEPVAASARRAPWAPPGCSTPWRWISSRLCVRKQTVMGWTSCSKCLAM